MAHSLKKGRKATQRARSSAAKLVAAYGPTTVNVASAPALLDAWEYFAESGRLPNESQDCTPHAPGRRGTASQEARGAAKDLLKAHGPPIRSESGTFCFNPEDGPEDRITISSECAAQALLDAMDRLAKTGWLVETEVKLERFMTREDYKQIRPQFLTVKAALEALAKLHPRSIRDLERMVSNKKL
jgi:hypothetical protein